MAQSFLSQIGGAINQGMQNYQDQQASMPDELTMKLMQINPEFAAQYSQQRAFSMQNEQERRKKAALSRIGKMWSTGGINPNNALAELALETGDTSLFSKAIAPTDLGATGGLVKQVMADNPGMGFTEALQLVQTGFRQNTRIDPVTGKVVAASGAASALGELEYGKNYGGTTGNLAARGELEPGVEADIVAAKSNAQYMEEGRQKLPIIQRSLQSKELRNEFIDQKITSIVGRSNEFTAGFGGALISAVPGSPAFDLKSDIETLLANAGFDRLQEMRDNSPTGGALGQVTEIELALLQASEQSLMQSQSMPQLIKNLQDFKKQRDLSLQNIRKAYEQDYARFGGANDPNLPSPKETIDFYGQQIPRLSVEDLNQAAPRRRYNPATGRLE